jgi:hypothetical protein
VWDGTGKQAQTLPRRGGYHRRMDPRYPIGKPVFVPQVTDALRRGWIEELGAFPAGFRTSVATLSPSELDTPYREGGWTARQVVHHVADSHLNLYIRVRWALTEDRPAIKTYNEKLWADLADARSADPALSLTLLDAVHARLGVLLDSLTPDEFAREVQHPERGAVNLDWFLQLYTWHGRHHRAHVLMVKAA